MPASTIQKNDTEEQDAPTLKEQAIDEANLGYGCICGFKTRDKVEFNTHVMLEAKRDGKGTHKSLGRVDMTSGDVVTAPWADRSIEQKRDTTVAVKGKQRQVRESSKKEQVKSPLASSQQIHVVPRTYTMDYTPVMRMAQDAAIEFFHWRPDMPLENFIDTVLYMFFKEHGITLCGYIVDESLRQKEDDNGHRT